MNDPLVSVILPAHNCEAFVEMAVRSVMEQTYRHWELLAIDDGSTDATCEIIRRLADEDERIRFLRNPANIGVAGTRNRGLDESRGEYVAFLEGADLWCPDKLEKQLQSKRAEKAHLAYTSYAVVDRHGNPGKHPYVVPASTTFSAMLKENVMGCSTVMLSRRVADSYRFIQDFYQEDYCLWLSALRDGYKAVGCREVLVSWRWIANSRSFNKWNSAHKRWKIYREYLGYSFVKSAYYFLMYTVNGVKKYFG